MQQDILDITAQVEAAAIGSAADLEAYRLTFLSRERGLVSKLADKLKEIPKDQKAAVGKAFNLLKQAAEKKFEENKIRIESEAKARKATIDLTLPGRRYFLGSEHPVMKVLSDMKSIFFNMGFELATGPEIETDDYNFGKLNFPPDHPARDMQDTFFIDKDVVLRTHTSPVQVRVMLSQKPPIRAIMPGKTYRNEAISVRSYCLFHQIEGLYVDKGVTFADLKSTVYSFAKQMFGSDVKMRFRPSFFPFTEPSAEVDITCYLCGGKGCRVCKHTGWLEILGCGMVHPNVLKACGVDAEVYTGFAFGMGIERTTLLRYNIPDIRLLFENDIRMLEQFE